VLVGFETIEPVMAAQPASAISIEPGIDLILISRYLERIGDHATKHWRPVRSASRLHDNSLPVAEESGCFTQTRRSRS
jgi:phosphate uptake regulator